MDTLHMWQPCLYILMVQVGIVILGAVVFFFIFLIALLFDTFGSDYHDSTSDRIMEFLGKVALADFILAIAVAMIGVAIGSLL